MNTSPLDLEDLRKIEATKLSSLEKHYVRLLAHCLVTFKTMCNGSSVGQLPEQSSRLKWCLEQPILEQSGPFISILLEQLERAGDQLEKLAEDIGVTPLELEIDDLIEANLASKSNSVSLFRDL